MNRLKQSSNLCKLQQHRLCVKLNPIKYSKLLLKITYQHTNIKAIGGSYQLTPSRIVIPRNICL